MAGMGLRICRWLQGGGREKVEEVLRRAGVDGERRAEEVSGGEFGRLHAVFYEG